MGNRFTPGCCCEKCLAFRIGLSDDNYTPVTGAELVTQIDRYSADPAVIVEHPSHPGKPAIAGHGTWSAKRLAAPGGFVLRQYPQAPVTEYDYSIIAAPAGVHPDDLETDPQSIILRAAAVPGTGPWAGQMRYTLALRGDGWDATGYPLANGTQSVEHHDPIIPEWIAWLVDSVETAYVSGQNPSGFGGLPTVADGYGIATPALSRQLNSDIPRRVWIRNHREEPLVLALLGTRITDIRHAIRLGNDFPSHSVPEGLTARCPPLNSLAPGCRRNDPIAIAADIAGGHSAPPRCYTTVRTLVTQPGSETSYDAQTTFPSPGDPPAPIPIPEEWYDGEVVITAPVAPQLGVRVQFVNPRPHTTEGDSYPPELIYSTTTISIEVVQQLYLPAAVGSLPLEITWFLGEFPVIQRIVLSLRFPPWDPGKMPPLTVTGSVAVGQMLGDYEVLDVQKPAAFVRPVARKIWRDLTGTQHEWETEPFNPSVTITQFTG